MRRAYAYTLLIVLLWGVSLVTNKALLLAERGGEKLTPLEVAFWGIAVGWVALLLVVAARGKLPRVRDVAPRGWAALVAMGLFGWAGYTVALNFAFTRLPLPDAIIINYLHPVFVVLFQGAGFGSAARAITGWEQAGGPARRPGPARLAVGLLLCLLGVAVIATGGQLAALGRSRSAAGALAALFAAFAWGVYSNLGRFVTPRAGREMAVTSDLRSFLAMTFGLAMLGAGAGFAGGLKVPGGFRVPLYLGPWGPAPAGAWELIAVLGIAVYCASFTLWLCALELGARHGEAHKLPPLTYLTPVLGVALGWAVLHESFGPAFWPGAALIAAGNAVNVWPSGRVRPRRG